MEHRYSERIIVNIQAMIYKSALPIAIARVRNMSRHGIFIDWTPDAAALNQPLGIELFSYGNRVEPSNRFTGFVVRKETQGIALCLFDDCQPAYARYAKSITEKQKASIVIRCANLPPQNANSGIAAEGYLAESA